MSSNSEVAVCNSALLLLGADLITSLDQDYSDRAVLMNHIYNETRDAVLEAYPWNFAQARTSIGADSDTPSFGWGYQFSLPGASDNYCLKVHYRYPKDSNLAFKVEGRKLLADDDTVYIVYTKRITDVAKFSFLFKQALAALLAYKACYAVTGSTSKEDKMLAMYEGFLADAEDSDTQEGTPDTLQSDDLTEVRF